MKKLFILLFLASATTFVSCNKDDDEAQSTADLMVGSWEFSQEGVMMSGTEMLEPYDHWAPECGKDYIQFNDNGTGLIYEYDNFEGCETMTDGFTYTTTGNDFTLLVFGEEITGTIMSIDSSTLKMKFIYEDDEEGNFEYIWVFTRK